MAEENVQSSFEFTTGDAVDGISVQPVSIPVQLTDDLMVDRPLKLVRILPGGATVTLGSEKEKKDVE